MSTSADAPSRATARDRVATRIFVAAFILAGLVAPLLSRPPYGLAHAHDRFTL
jgi:hypothetical protein